MISSGWELARPAHQRWLLLPRPVIYVTRSIEHDLAAVLTALSSFRRARWRGVVLHRSLADDERVTRAFRDGIVWADGSRDPEEAVTRLCLALNLERAPGERLLECRQRWAGAVERRVLLIIDDAMSAERLTSLIAGLGPQVVALITTQQGAEIRAEAERWLPADTVIAVGIHGLAPSEGRKLVEAVVERSPIDAEWELVQEISELVGWHPMALRLTGIEGREVGWQGILGALRAGRLPWIEAKRPVMRQWARLHPDQQAWLAALIEKQVPDVCFTTDEAAHFWRADAAIARHRLWILMGCGLITEEGAGGMAFSRWRVSPVARLVLVKVVH